MSVKLLKPSFEFLNQKFGHPAVINPKTSKIFKNLKIIFVNTMFYFLLVLLFLLAIFI